MISRMQKKSEICGPGLLSLFIDNYKGRNTVNVP